MLCRSGIPRRSAYWLAGVRMTASESLKALNDLATYSGDAMERSKESAIRGRALLNALPALIAVVEAADGMRQSALWVGMWGEPYHQSLSGSVIAYETALAALETALEGER